MPEIRVLSRDLVARLLPPIPEQIDRVERIYRALAAGRIELPPKPGIHPRENAFIHAMPAYLADDDVAACKWVSGYPGNPGRGLPYISGVIVVNDPETGQPLALLDGAEITAARTAAASGLCIRRFAPDGWRTVALLGCGEQGRYHARIVRALNPDATIQAWDPVAVRAASVDERTTVAPDAHAAVAGAEIIVTAGPIVAQPQPVVADDWLGDRYLLLPLDFDANVQPRAIAATDLFAVDDIEQFEYYRSAGHFTDWPTPHGSVGDALTRMEAPRRVACVNLGIGALDAAFAAAVLSAAREHDAGVMVTI